MRIWSLAAIGFMMAGSGMLFAADPAVGANSLSQSRIDEIIQKFAAKEAAFAKARENYTYRQTAEVEALDPSGGVLGKWEIVSDIIFDPTGNRTEHVIYAPVSTLGDYLILTPEDMQDLKSVQPFVLTTSELPQYLIRYLGHQQVDEIGCYVFAVKPKKMEGDQRYFEGEVWVDDQELQIVKTYGRGVGNAVKQGQRFPKFETYRQQIDGKFWFPTYTIANDTLHFKDTDQRIKEIVRYENYKQFKSSSTITFGDAVDGTQNPDQNKNQSQPKK
ncbi:MAG TPA: hypothetical protein VFW83_06830 [Bryobacteraceae bacterium]|nr:hypothetical protein [Bryobacteraceae bacterium]